ncbi:MAG TPA: Hsp70 family protein [Polyangiaceae bacterium]|jgi:molecular chaperone DnaK (HSP70)
MGARWCVGIDLGTTNTVVAAAPVEGGAAGVVPLDQLVGPGQVAARALLPSALHAPLDGEGVEDPFGDAPWVVGEHARRRGAEVAGRLVASSKSWLVHAGVDRTAPILPWGAPEDAPRLSPVDAASRVLAHVRCVWDAGHPDTPLAAQDVVLTVPASFDEVARELTVDAATRAGLAPKLLEEPQAAFYDWMTRAGTAGAARLLASTDGEALVLVVDVGGGTTDLSLVKLSAADRVTRVAVGPHLLLGGDNMDLALAHLVEPRLVDEGKLEAARFAQLVAACRAAKESLLGESSPDDAPLTVVTTGARLLGSTRTTRLSREEAERVVLEGFFPAVDLDARPQRARGALVAFGLPYERDVAITRHVVAFLARHLPAGTLPNAVLLNGGVFRASRIADRLVEAMSGWRGGRPVTRLPDADPDLAVARGAVAYALARRGSGVRIGGGSARGYFVVVAADEGRRRAVCVVPRGAEEGVLHGARDRTFALAVGTPVRFDLLASHEVDASAGDVVDAEDDRFARLPPLAVTLDGARGGEVRVVVEGELTPLGTLDLACVEVDGSSRRHRLAFQLRESAGPSLPPPAASASQVPRRMDAARELVERAFGKPRADAGGREAKDLLRELEKVLGERAQWTTEVNRSLYDALVAEARGRRRSSDHERVFWLLAGWCIRPGFGDPLDSRRVLLLQPLLAERLAFPAEVRGWQQFFIAWRRAAGGLDEAAQTLLRDLVDPSLATAEAGLKKPKKPVLSLDDGLDAASCLERVPPTRRSALGGWVLERTWTDRDPRLWSALGRLGARVPAYSSVHHVVAPHVAERWLDHLLREKWDAVPTAAQAAVQLARCTGDRARDVAERVRREVEQRLVRVGADPEWIRAVREVVAVEERERAAFFGDALPPGLRLVT